MIAALFRLKKGLFPFGRSFESTRIASVLHFTALAQWEFFLPDMLCLPGYPGAQVAWEEGGVVTTTRCHSEFGWYLLILWGIRRYLTDRHSS